MNFIQKHRSLSDFSTMQVGGEADYYAEINTREELEEAFAFAGKEDIPVVILGQGSNMIVPDEGIRGLVIRLMNDEAEFGDGGKVTIGGGMLLSRFIVACQRVGINTMDYWMGIPGTMGAAISGNVGIPDHEIGDLVQSVEIFDGKEFKSLKPKDCEFRYRGTKIRDNKWLVWSADLLLNREDVEAREVLVDRISKQPRGPSCGSFFKNPNPSKGLFAGKLIDECGLKGTKIGGAFIPEKHANFLMNDGTATASDVLELARFIKKEVLDQKGVVLENEVSLCDERGNMIEL